MVAHVNALAVAPKLVAPKTLSVAKVATPVDVIDAAPELIFTFPATLRVVVDMVKKVARPVELTVITLAEALPIVSD